MLIPEFYERYAENIKNQLPGLIVRIPNLLIALVKIEMAGGMAYLVGGTARDIIYDAYYHKYIVMPDDVDIEVFGLTQEKLESIIQLELTGNNFPVYNTSYKDIDANWYGVQWSLPRYERKVSKGHNGFDIIVSPDMPTFDAAMRRELTINSIMISLRGYFIVDHFGGINDLLVSKMANVVNNTSFVEDALRVLRAARFIARFGLMASRNLIANAQEMVGEYADLTPELREKELTKIFWGRNIFEALNFLDDAGWLKLIINDETHYKRVVNDTLNKIYHFDKIGVGEFKNLLQERQSIERELVNWSILLHDRSDIEINAFFKGINPNWDKTTIYQVTKIVYHGNKILTYPNKLSASYIARYLQYNCKELMGEVIVYIAQIVGDDWMLRVTDAFQYSLYKETFPMISGDDILQFIPEGKKVGLIREFFIRQHIEGIITDRSLALKMLPNVISLIERGIVI